VQEYRHRGGGAVTADIEVAVIVVRSLGSPFQVPAFPVDPEPRLPLPVTPSTSATTCTLSWPASPGVSC
jgi:hypothetical protein